LKRPFLIVQIANNDFRVKFSYIKITGIELNFNLAKKAKHIYSHVIVGDIEQINIKKRYDLINCGDIIEHLYNPWEIMQNIYRWLTPKGYLIGSVPNISYWSTVKDLLNGKFEYIPAGLLCVGHIRFFTEQGIIDLLKDVGFKIDIWRPQIVPPTPKGSIFIQNMETLGFDVRSLSTYSFLFRAKK